MTAQAQWDDQADDGDELVDDVDPCTRCGADMMPGPCTDVTVHYGGGPTVEWFLCDDCADSLAAWRLSKDAPLPAEQLDERGGVEEPKTWS